MINFEKYMDISFKEKGRDLSGLDCYGLIYIFFKNELGIILPDFLEVKYHGDWSKKGEDHILENIPNTFNKVVDSEFKKFDLHLFFDSTGIASHVGMNIGNGKFLHINEGSYSRISNLGIYKRLLYGTLRYRFNA